MALDNDTRGWIMTALSGIACLLGASFIFIDIIVRAFPRGRNFRIDNSNGFLSSSLSLSFGVMVFSSLYKMMPSAKKSLLEGGYTDKAAAWILISLFLAGAMITQLLSYFSHRFLPSHVVDCDHTHEDSIPGEEIGPCGSDEEEGILANGKPLAEPNEFVGATQLTLSSSTLDAGSPSLKPWSALISPAKPTCAGVACHGYGQPCGDCFRNVQARSESSMSASRPLLPKTLSTPVDSALSTEHTPLLSALATPPSHPTPPPDARSEASIDHPLHHHHVPTNAFLSLGMQTATAIALHKLPEGFITYATNHANPRLGLAVFLSLFVHNLTEGFALALPLYLALHSRPRALLWSALVGGASQPLGAAVAALWFRVAGRNGAAPGEAVYGAMFAVVAGMLASVAMQLFNQALLLTHSGELCMVFAFVGMGIIGASSAMTA